MSNVFRSIVVGLDFSKYSKKVLDQAVALGKFYSVPVVAIYCSGEKVGDEIREYFDDYYDLRRRGVKATVICDVPEHGLIKEARKQRAPLILVGHKGHSVISEFLLGSAAERLALKSPFPVWIQRGNKIVKPLKFLVPHDLKKPSDNALKLARQLKGVTEALFVSHEPVPVLDYETWVEVHNEVIKINKKALLKFRRSHPRTKIRSAKGDPAEAIIRYGRKFSAVIMSPHSHREGFHGFGKVTNKVVRGAPVPVLIA
jgi:nucleotide-binding universal stress UspA family protein